MAVDLADTQGDEGHAEASGEQAHLRDLEVLGEVGDEAVLGGGAGDVEGEEGPETIVGAAGPDELLAQGQRGVFSGGFRSGGLRLVVVVFSVGVGEGGTISGHRSLGFGLLESGETMEIGRAHV